MESLQYQIAGLPVAVRAAAAGAIDDLAPIYRGFPTGESPLLTIDIVRIAGGDRERGPEYPGFRRSVLPDGRMHVERFDAEGEITTGALPLTASFRVGPSANSLEACLRIAASLALPRTGAMILHASAVVHAGRALVFTGASGAGKSTISTLLPAAFASCTRLADELLVLRRAPTGWEVVVPPYLGPAGIAHGGTAPLASIDFLVQAPVHARTRFPAATAVRELLRNVLVYVAEPRTAALVLGLADELTRELPCYRLEFRKDTEVAVVLGIAPTRAAG